jgi:hypothetical protein
VPGFKTIPHIQIVTNESATALRITFSILPQC